MCIRDRTKYKKAVQEEQIKQNVKTSQLYTINTEMAYEVWGIDAVSYTHLTRFKR